MSADTLVYFGALEEVVAAAAAALRPGGLFIFTLESAAPRPDRTSGSRLHGRYSHAQPYVERLLRGAGIAPRTSRTPSCGWNPACRSPAWWFGPAGCRGGRDDR